MKRHNEILDEKYENPTENGYTIPRMLFGCFLCGAVIAYIIVKVFVAVVWA